MSGLNLTGAPTASTDPPAGGRDGLSDIADV